MRVYIITGFAGRYPVGTSAVIVAKDTTRAFTQLNEALEKAQLSPMTAEQFNQRVKLVHTHEPSVEILQDGDY